MPTSEYIPEPSVILLGCQPWPPVPQGPGCPACGPGVREGHDSIHCAVCSSSSPRREAQIRRARAGMEARSQLELAEADAAAHLRKIKVPTESLRRRIWNGARGGISSPNPEVTNLAKVGRDWLIAHGWEPDWSLVLDRHGRVVGRLETLTEVEG